MKVDEYLTAVLRENGLEEGKDADEFFNGLEDGQKAEFRTEARFLRMESNISAKVTERIDTSSADTLRKLHERLDKVAPINAGAGGNGDDKDKAAAAAKAKAEADAKKAKEDGKVITIPEGYVKKEDMDAQIKEIRGELTKRDIRHDCNQALKGIDFMPGGADNVALKYLMESAERKEDGRTIFRKTKQDGDQPVIQELSLSDAIKALRGEQKFLFKAEVADGGGGGGGEKAGSLPDNLTYEQVMDDPNLMGRVLRDPDKGPDFVDKLEETYKASATGRKVEAVTAGKQENTFQKVRKTVQGK